MDFAGPIKYRKSPPVKGKAYLVLYACSLTRALYLEELPNARARCFLEVSSAWLLAERGQLKCFLAMEKVLWEQRGG